MNKQALSEQSLVECEICLKDVPAAAAESVESAEYVACFCGLE